MQINQLSTGEEFPFFFFFFNNPVLVLLLGGFNGLKMADTETTTLGRACSTSSASDTDEPAAKKSKLSAAVVDHGLKNAETGQLAHAAEAGEEGRQAAVNCGRLAEAAGKEEVEPAMALVEQAPATALLLLGPAPAAAAARPAAAIGGDNGPGLLIPEPHGGAVEAHENSALHGTTGAATGRCMSPPVWTF